MEVPRLGVESELQLPAYTTATATLDLNDIGNLHCNLWQHWILNPLSKARDQTHILMDTRQVLNLLSHNRNSIIFNSYFFGPCPPHAEVPRQGIKPMPHQQPELLQQHLIPNPLYHRRTPYILFKAYLYMLLFSWLNFRYHETSFFFSHTHSMQKFLSWGSNPCHSTDLSHSSDNAGSLTFRPPGNSHPYLK